jgi:hypothetical protein
MVGAEYPSAQIAAVTLGYALPTRYLLAAGFECREFPFLRVGPGLGRLALMLAAVVRAGLLLRPAPSAGLRVALASGMVGARDPVPTHRLMVLRGPDVSRELVIWPPEQARVVIVLGGVGVFLLKFRHQSGVPGGSPWKNKESR